MGAVIAAAKPHIDTVIENLKGHWVSIMGSGGTWVAAITARQEQLEYWLRNAATIAALVVSALTALHIIKNWNKK